MGCQGTSKRNNIYDHCDIFVFLRGCFLALFFLLSICQHWTGASVCSGRTFALCATECGGAPLLGTDLPICHWAIQCDSHAFSNEDSSSNTNGFNPPPILELSPSDGIGSDRMGFEWFADGAWAQRQRKMMHKSACPNRAFLEFVPLLIDTKNVSCYE